MVTHSSSLAWRIPWTEEPGRLQSMGRKESDMTEQVSTHIVGRGLDSKRSIQYHCAFVARSLLHLLSISPLSFVEV